MSYALYMHQQQHFLWYFGLGSIYVLRPYCVRVWRCRRTEIGNLPDWESTWHPGPIYIRPLPFSFFNWNMGIMTGPISQECSENSMSSNRLRTQSSRIEHVVGGCKCLLLLHMYKTSPTPQGHGHITGLIQASQMLQQYTHERQSSQGHLSVVQPGPHLSQSSFLHVIQSHQ